MQTIIEIIANMTGNPTGAAIGLGVLGLFLLLCWHWAKPWMQAIQDAKNKSQVSDQSGQAQDENQNLNNQADQIFKGGSK